MFADYMENMLNSWGFGSKDASLKEKFAQHQKRHHDLISSYQRLCQDSYAAMLSSTMKGDIKEMQNTHKVFLEGLNKTMESMFENNIELASHAPEKLAKVINSQREAYENLLSSFPQAKQIKSKIDNHYFTKGMRKFALGTVTAALTAVAMPAASKATDLFQHDITQQRTMTGIQTIQTAKDQINQMLDTPFVETRDSYGKAKDLMPQGADFRTGDLRYANSRSAIYSGDYDRANYPKMPMVHSYRHTHFSSPLSAALPYARAPQHIESYLAQEQFREYEKVYSFVVAVLPSDAHGQRALKPQYLIHPDAPSFYKGKEYWSKIDWTVIPGAEGQIEPQDGSFQQLRLLHNTIVTHPAEQIIGNTMNLSGNVMHLRGFNKISEIGNSRNVSSKDMYSLVVYQDKDTQKNIMALTYHWLLSPNSYDDLNTSLFFKDTMKKSKTMRELIINLENAEGFEDLTGELKRFVGLSEVSPIVTDTHHLGKDVPFALQGFSSGEGTHRWTEGNKAIITIPVRDGDRQVKNVIFKGAGAFLDANHVQQLSVFLNDKKINDFQYSLNANSHTIEIPVPPSIKGDAIISFDMPNAISPKKLGMSEDSRNLGISFKDMDVMYRKQAIEVASYHLGQDVPYQLTGFSGGEGTHRWTNGDNASITIPIVQGDQRVKSITFNNISAFVTGNHRFQDLIVLLNGKPVVSRSGMSISKNLHTIKIRIPENLTGDAVISFVMPDATSPKEVGLGEDGRKLGISFQEMDVAFIGK